MAQDWNIEQGLFCPWGSHPNTQVPFPSPGNQNILHAQPLYILTSHLRARKPCLSHYQNPKDAPAWGKQRPYSDLTPDFNSVTVLFHVLPIKAQQYQRYAIKNNCTCHSRSTVLTVVKFFSSLRNAKKERAG